MKSFQGRFDVAVFPLMDTVLFPGVTLPIQVMEERYGRMLRDLQNRGWPVAVSLLIPESGQTGSQFRLSTVCGAGEVEVFKEYPDGRSDILVHGRQRVRLRTLLQKEPYLIMEAEPLDAAGDLRPRVGPGPGFEQLLSLVRAWVFLNPAFAEEMSLVFDEFKDEAELTDFFAFHFLKKARDQQFYLDTPDADVRALRLTAYLQTDLIRLNRKLQRKQKLRLIH